VRRERFFRRWLQFFRGAVFSRETKSRVAE
jgi:hypothetical protein